MKLVILETVQYVTPVKIRHKIDTMLGHLYIYLKNGEKSI